jgi:hypothetical protein
MDVEKNTVSQPEGPNLTALGNSEQKKPPVRFPTIDWLRMTKVKDGEVKEIWDFKMKEWTVWALATNAKHARECLWSWVQKINKVLYFKNHHFSKEEIEKYIPTGLINQVFVDAAEFEKLVVKEGIRLHGRMLTEALQKVIIPRWESRADYPTSPNNQQAGNQSTDINQSSWRMFFLDVAKEDAFSCTRFFSSLAEAVDWSRYPSALHPKTKLHTTGELRVWLWQQRSVYDWSWTRDRMAKERKWHPSQEQSLDRHGQGGFL